MTYATGALTHNRVCESIKPGGAREGRGQSEAERVLELTNWCEGTNARPLRKIAMTNYSSKMDPRSKEHLPMPISTVEGTSDNEVECRIRKAEAARNEIHSLLCDSRLPLYSSKSAAAESSSFQRAPLQCRVMGPQQQLLVQDPEALWSPVHGHPTEKGSPVHQC